MVGFIITENFEQLAGAAGFTNVTTGDMRNQVEAIVADVNAGGGLAGRPIEADVYVIDSTKGTSGAGVQQLEQEMCTHYTEDVQVLAVVSVTRATPTLLHCLADAQVLYLSTNGEVTQSTVTEVNGYWWGPSAVVQDRFIGAYVNQLVASGFLDSTATIGLLRFDRPDQEALTDAVLVPALAAHGLELHQQAAYGDDFATQSPNFVLQFNAAGVTHVLNLVGGNIVLFQQAAEQQLYRPAYALSSYDAPGSWVQVLAPPTQLTTSVGIGWTPLADVDLAHQPGDVSPNQTRCRELMEAAGEDMSSAFAQGTSHRLCDPAFLLQAAFARSGNATPAGLASGTTMLGSDYPSVMTFRNTFGPGRPDGADAQRGLVYTAACSCFEYAGVLQPLS